ncbi:DUF1501 domain-containing protein [Stieleria sp. TO1_6]|uniref:DUF1501 domain-containing protein n=1 Tax=Stieleria tagensis TaxID=2956795 RepID=UPI00209B6176|nr:DUF1501 domain-containing protein [Stieleria tagensis]MCO8123500.1 DUF1501 domain-containing protein [Stieleria tagensis]
MAYLIAQKKTEPEQRALNSVVDGHSWISHAKALYLSSTPVTARCGDQSIGRSNNRTFACNRDPLYRKRFPPCAFSALIQGLEPRDLLDQTLLVVNSEMGRTPKIGDPRSGGVGGAGRDHWTHCQGVLMAGGGIQGGQTYGSSDRLGEHPSDHPLTPADIAKTVYHAAGVDDLRAQDSQGRPYNLLEEGRPIKELFG